MDAPTDDKEAAPLEEGAARKTDSTNPAGVRPTGFGPTGPRPDGTRKKWTPGDRPLTAAALAKVWKKKRRQGSLRAGGTSRAFEEGGAVLYCDGRDARPFDEPDDAAPNENPTAASWEAGKDVLRRMAAIVREEADHSTDQPSAMKFYQSSIIFLNTLGIPPFDVSPRKIAEDLGISHDTVYERRQRFQDRLHDAGAFLTPPPPGARMGGADDAADRNRRRRESGRGPKPDIATAVEICGTWGRKPEELVQALMQSGGGRRPIARRTANRVREDAVEAGELVKRGGRFYAAGAGAPAVAAVKTNV